MEISLLSDLTAVKANSLALAIGQVVFYCALLLGPICTSAQERSGPASGTSESTSQTAGAKSKDAEPKPAMIIGMRTGETHLTSSPRAEGKIVRWFELQTASISTRYHFIEDSRGETTANNNQYQVTFKGRFKFDRTGKYSINAGVFTGNSFNGG